MPLPDWSQGGKPDLADQAENMLLTPRLKSGPIWPVRASRKYAADTRTKVRVASLPWQTSQKLCCRRSAGGRAAWLGTQTRNYAADVRIKSACQPALADQPQIVPLTPGYSQGGLAWQTSQKLCRAGVKMVSLTWQSRQKICR